MVAVGNRLPSKLLGVWQGNTVRVALDYYRILGLPVQAPAEQVSQAYSDRLQQLPHPEYSEVAIAARQQLLDEAYTVLSSPEMRSNYDKNFLGQSEISSGNQANESTDANPPEAEKETEPSYIPSLEISPHKLVGALLVLYELGEYAQVVQLCQPYLTSDRLNLTSDRADIILTICLSNLELGREQWQQRQYENAAASLEAGNRLLLKEGLFAELQAEITADIYKLRPYRILELIALPTENVTERLPGLQLLKDMLQDRGGIDGTGDDRSGLSTDDFLRFIQQLRGYLTAAEQQILFEAEAKRPSAVASYLAVYALIAQGFTQRQAAPILRAKKILVRLGKRQDVHLERAVCALLLGQTEEATSALELSQDRQAVAFVRDRSQGSPDLLPGLCKYSEEWLQTEVFPHFRDLANQRVSLKNYFADEQVQADLDKLPSEELPDWERELLEQIYTPTINSELAADIGRSSTAFSRGDGDRSIPRKARSSALKREVPSGSTISTVTPPELVLTSTPSDRALNSPTSRRRRRRARQRQTFDRSTTNGSAPSLLTKFNGLPKAGRGLVLLLAVVGALLAVMGMSYWLRPTSERSATAALESEQLSLRIDRPPLPIPTPQAQAVNPAAEDLLVEATARSSIEEWLKIKAKAMGKDHQIDALEKILVEPVLSKWRQRAETAKKNNSYGEYKHAVTVKSVKTTKANPDRATVEAAVNEVAQLYKGDRLDRSSSYSQQLLVKYELVRQAGNWHIQQIEVVK
jgi:curved DNA-binding protein CbpA